MFWLLVFILILTLFYLYKITRLDYWKKKGVVQNEVYPLFGDSISLFKGYSFNELLLKQYHKYSKERYIGLYTFSKAVLLLRDPELIKQICVKDFDHFINHDFLSENTDPLWCNNLFALKGSKWKNMRHNLNPFFTSSKIKQMFSLMTECADNFLNYYMKNDNLIQEVEFKDAFSKYTTDIITVTSFGIKCDSLANPENDLFIKTKQTTNLFSLLKTFKFILKQMLPSLKNLIKTTSFDEEVSTFFYKIVKDIIDYREKNNYESNDIISFLMQATNKEKKRHEKEKKNDFNLTLDEVTAHAVIFLLAGFETTAITMSFIAYELVLNSEIQQKLIKELDEFRRKNKELTFESLSELTYLDMVISETLRKWSPIHFMDRKCTKPYTIKSKISNENDLHLNEGDILWIPITALHNDPKYWENPENFNPERFSPENKDKIIPYSYIPFGLGARGCIGMRFGLTEIKTIFCKILEHYEFVKTDKTSIIFNENKRRVNLDSANGFWLGLKKRNTL